jgi:Na+/H+ antiporter NhaC
MILADFDFSMLYVALGAGAIALIVFLLRKFVPGLSGEDKKQTEEEIAEENISNKLSSLEEEEKVRKATEEDEE